MAKTKLCNFLIFIIMILFISACGKQEEEEKEVSMPKQLFGIEKDDYEVLDEFNGLNRTRLSGVYLFKIKVESGQVDALCSDINSEGYTLLDKDQMDENESVRKTIKDRTGLEYSEYEMVYLYSGPTKRRAVSWERHRTKTGYVVFSETGDDSYEVYLLYVE